MRNTLTGSLIRKTTADEKIKTARAAIGSMGTIPGSPMIDMRNKRTRSVPMVKRRNRLGREFQKCFLSLRIRRSSSRKFSIPAFFKAF